MPLSQSSKQGLIVTYFRSLPAKGVLRKRMVLACMQQSNVALGAASYVQSWVGRQLR